MTPSRYRAFLQATLAVVEPLEPALRGWLGTPSPPARVDCLRADLAALHAAPLEAAASPPLPASEAEAYGCAYVLEGSALGGIVLASLVTRDLGKGAPTAYLTLRGAGTRPEWMRFLQTLQSFGRRSDGYAHRRAAAMAADTFAAYATSFRTAGFA